MWDNSKSHDVLGLSYVGPILLLVKQPEANQLKMKWHARIEVQYYSIPDSKTMCTFRKN